LHSKLPGVGTTIFTVMSQMAADHNALNLSQGFPDFAVPAGLIACVRHHLERGDNQYAPMAGVPALREAIAAKTARVYGHDADPDTGITVTSGATEALYSAITAFVHPGDEVIVFDPAYDSYDPAVRLAGGTPVHVPLMPPAFAPDWDRVAGAIGPRTRMIVLNTPHNPTGAVLTAGDMATLGGLVRDKEIILLGDEVYESLLLYPELAARSLVVSSFGKTFHATGWKIGYCIAPAALMAEFRRVHQFVQFCVVTPMQHALADYLASDPEHYLGLPAFYQQKRDRFCELVAPSRFSVTPSAGTYFQTLDYGELSDETDTEFARRLTREHGIAGIPVSVFCEQPTETRLLRFCFAKDGATLERAAQILCAI